MQRLQLSRAAGWRKPDGAITVARPSRWGNPFTLEMYRADYPEASVHARRAMAVSDFRGLVEGRWEGFDDTPPYPSINEIRAELTGHDLLCWCPAEGPCHADVLIEICLGAPSGLVV